MNFDPQIHHRRSIRLQGYDYSQAGAYYFTIVVYMRECLFGEIVASEIKLNQFGEIVRQTWFDLPNHYTNIELDEFCIMPNHVHGIIMLTNVGNPTADAAIQTNNIPLSEVIRAFKSFSARRINVARQTQGIPVWQRNYYEHIIRDQQEYLAIQAYIIQNPRNWEYDNEFLA